MREQPQAIRSAVKTIRGILSTDTGLKWWEERKIWFNATFQARVDELKAQANQDDRISISVHMARKNK